MSFAEWVDARVRQLLAERTAQLELVADECLQLACAMEDPGPIEIVVYGAWQELWGVASPWPKGSRYAPPA